MTVAHTLWQRLPHRWRRALFSRATLALAHLRPASATSAPDGAPVVVAGALRAPTGLGQAARLAIRALQACGHPVRAIDLTRDLKQPLIVGPADVPEAAAGPGLLLVFVNPPVSSYVLTRIPAQILAGKRRIGCFVSEYDRYPSDWGRHAALYDEICAPSAHTCSLMAAALGRPVRLLPHPVALAVPPPRPARPAGSGAPFTVGFVGDMVAASGRKNPLAAVQAMAKAFGGDPTARLALILNGGEASHPVVAALLAEAAALGVPVSVDARLLPEAETLGRYAGFDAYLSLHRAEGFGLTIAEAMLAGCPTVATSAPPVDTMVDATTGFPVAWRPVPAKPLPDLDDPGPWAEPDIADAADQLRLIRAHPEIAAARAEAGRQRMLTLFGAASFCGPLGLGAQRPNN